LIFYKILTIVEDFLNLICESEDEAQVQNIISVQLGIKPRNTFKSPFFPNIEVDISKDNWAIEIKYNAKFYDGVGQLLAKKVLYERNKKKLRPDELRKFDFTFY